MNIKLPPDFYLQDTIDVAEQLLGKRLVHELPSGEVLSGIITETEAYLGVEDPACHTFSHRQTERTRTMYGPGGIAYVYLIYGMYNCFNVVTMSEGVPEAVLIRGLYPLEGLELMRARRPKARRDAELTDGPGKLCEAMQISRAHDGLSLTTSHLYITDDMAVDSTLITSSPRIGIDYAGDAALWPLRFSIAAEDLVFPRSNP